MPVKKTKKTEGKKTANEQFKVTSEELLKKVKHLIKEGNVRRIIIKNERGRVMVEIPVTFALVGAVFAPMLAAVGALAALLNKATIEVERK